MILMYAVRKWLTFYVATSLFYRKDIFLTHREVNLLQRVWDSIKLQNTIPICAPNDGEQTKGSQEKTCLWYLIYAFCYLLLRNKPPPKFSGWKQLIIISCNSLGWLGTARQSSIGLAWSLSLMMSDCSWGLEFTGWARRLQDGFFTPCLVLWFT